VPAARGVQWLLLGQTALSLSLECASQRVSSATCRPAALAAPTLTFRQSGQCQHHHLPAICCRLFCLFSARVARRPAGPKQWPPSSSSAGRSSDKQPLTDGLPPAFRSPTSSQKCGRPAGRASLAGRAHWAAPSPHCFPPRSALPPPRALISAHAARAAFPRARHCLSPRVGAHHWGSSWALEGDSRGRRASFGDHLRQCCGQAVCES